MVITADFSDVANEKLGYNDQGSQAKCSAIKMSQHRLALKYQEHIKSRLNSNLNGNEPMYLLFRQKAELLAS